jgi:hypothetical protein
MSRGRVLHAYSFFLHMTYNVKNYNERVITSVKNYNERVITSVKNYNELVVMNDKLIKSGLLSMSSVMYGTQKLSI